MFTFFTLVFYNHEVQADDSITLWLKKTNPKHFDLHTSTFKLSKVLAFLVCPSSINKKGTGILNHLPFGEVFPAITE